MISKNLLFGLVVIFCFSGCKSEKEDKTEFRVADEAISPKELIGKDYLIDDQHSYIGFKIKYFGYSPVRGRFNEFDGTLFYDDSSLGSLSASVFIDISTINTGNETRDNDLIKEGSWFDAANHPIASFQSKEMRTATDGSFQLDGVLTIKGISKEVSLEFEKPTDISRDWAANEQVDFTGKTVINRQDFEIVGGDFWRTVMEDGLTQLSDEVEIELNLHCRRPDYTARYDSAEATDIDKVVLDRIRSKGVKTGLSMIDSLARVESISSGKLSTIGYTLEEWSRHEDARRVFEKKKELFGASTIVLNQLGINSLRMGSLEEAKDLFNAALQKDSLNSRSIEYLRLIEKM